MGHRAHTFPWWSKSLCHEILHSRYNDLWCAKSSEVATASGQKHLVRVPHLGPGLLLMLSYSDSLALAFPSSRPTWLNFLLLSEETPLLSWNKIISSSMRKSEPPLTGQPAAALAQHWSQAHLGLSVEQESLIYICSYVILIFHKHPRWHRHSSYYHKHTTSSSSPIMSILDVS